MALVAYLILAVPSVVKLRSQWNWPSGVNSILMAIWLVCAAFATLGVLVVLISFVYVYHSPVYVAYEKDGCHRLTEEIREGHLQWYDSNGKPVDLTRDVLWDD
jgi:hypothetical protein